MGTIWLKEAPCCYTRRGVFLSLELLGLVDAAGLDIKQEREKAPCASFGITPTASHYQIANIIRAAHGFRDDVVQRCGVRVRATPDYSLIA